MPALKCDENVTDWENLDCCRGKEMEMVRIHLQMDKEGSVHWLCRYQGGKIKVWRHNPDVEMGEDNFIQCVYEFRSETVYFFVYQNQLDKFYLMDEKKKVRCLVKDEHTGKLVLEKEYELCKLDQGKISYTDFDEFSISNGCLHWNAYVFFLIDNVAKDNPTWSSESVMAENFAWVAGPRLSKKTGLILYKESF